MIFEFYILHFNCYALSSKHIRVAIIQDASTIRLKVKGFYEVINSSNHKILYRGKNLNTTVTTYTGGVLLGNIKSKADKLLIKSDDPAAIMVDGRMFRGNIQLIKKENAHLLVLNQIDLEDYIKGILYHEASHYWPQEALKAQAIAVRTYALYQMQENRLKDYDVTSDIYSQVYGGRTSERYRTNRIVDKTTGYTLTYKDKIFSAYYHATCGGNTEDAALLWNIDIAPLKGVACGFCKDSPHFSWHYVLAKDELNDKLQDAGYNLSDIKDVVILGQDKSGRITNLKLVSQDKEMEILAKDLRRIIGPNIIRSTNFKINPVRNTELANLKNKISNGVNLVNHDVVFEGLGWGHGVGLCQWGAYFMAKAGYTAEQILKYYYPGSNLTLNP